MKIVIRLALAHIATHWIRNILTVLAASFSVCLIVWIFGTYDAVLEKSEAALARLLGPYDAVLFAAQNPEIPLPAAEIDQVVADEGVDSITSLAVVPVWRINPDAKRPQRPFGPTAVAGRLSEPPFELKEGKWLPEKPSLAEPFDAVLSDSEADVFGLKVGETFVANTRGGQFQMKLIGTLRQPAIARMLGGMYVAPKVIERLGGRPFEPNLTLITLKEGVEPEAFEKRWKALHEPPEDKEEADSEGKKPESHAPAVKAQLVLLGNVQRDLSSSGIIGQLRVQGLYSATLACLAGSFIICITLSMGVDERVRQFALLRAVALTRRQTAGMLVAESVALSLAGLAVGVFLGWLLLCGTAYFNPELFDTIPGVSGQCVLMCALSLLFGAVLAAIPPIWAALRVRPLDVTAPTGRASGSRFPFVAMGAGLVLILVQPINVFVLDMPVSPLFWVCIFVGSLCHAVGFLLLSPTFVLIAEKLFTTPVGLALHIDRRLLGDQLSANFWRSAATAAALTIGLGLFVSVQIWGNSIIEPFLPGEGLPDLIVSFQPAGLVEEDLEQVAAAPGLSPEGCVPVAIAQPILSPELFASRKPPKEKTAEEKSHAEGQEKKKEGHKRREPRKRALLMLGVDPDRAIGGRRPVMKMRFLEGDAKSAAAKLKAGGCVVIPDTFAAKTGLGLGDKFKVLGSKGQEDGRQYEVAGVVTIPGWQMVTHISGMHQRGTHAAGAVFASFDDIRKEYGVERVNHVWANMERGADVDAIKKHMQAIAEKNAGISVTLPVIGKITAFKPYVSVLETAEIEAAIRRRARYIIWLASIFPIIALLVASIAVANTIMASIRARRWEFGILRSVALTRGNLLRLVLGESILLGLVACLLSFAAGLVSAWCGMGIAARIVLGDVQPALVLPWGPLFLGFATAIAFALLAAILPAYATARRDPLTLLQSGRSAM